MPTIKTFDRTNLRVLAAEVSAALEPVAKKYGLSLVRGNGTFSPTNYRLKVEFNVVQDGATAATRQEVVDFQRSAHFYGLDPSDLGKTVNVYGKMYKIIGLMPNRRRYPILVETVKGRQVCIPAEQVVDALNRLKGLKTKLDNIKAAAGADDEGMPSISTLVGPKPLSMEEWMKNGFTGTKNEDSRNGG
jgi:hypothetical protein